MSCRSLFTPLLLSMVMLTLAACQSGEERAEEHFQNALALMAEGDVARAKVEFHNVFQNNGLHREARASFAAMLRREGDPEQSYSQYLRLVEQYPDDVEGRIALAEMALEFRRWEEARRHGTRALEIAPDHPAAPVIEVYLDYLTAIEDEDELARQASQQVALALLEEDPEGWLLQQLVLDGLVRDGRLEDALNIVEQALETNLQSRFFHDARLQILVGLDRPDDVEAALRQMVELFPEDNGLATALLQFLVSKGDVEAAITFLEDFAARANTLERRQDALMALVRLHLENDGLEAAIAELNRIISEAGEGAATFQILRASLMFDGGGREAAIAELEELRQQDLSVEEQSRVGLALAQMRLVQGDEEAARALVEAVLEADPGEPEALKMRAGWLIQDDETDRAIGYLRTALDSAPDDAEALTLMAQAHTRNGNRQLAREFLALAVEASGSAPAETLRYARVLVEEERYLRAEELVIEALRLVPSHFGLLTMLGDIYVRLEDWPRAEQVERSLRDAGTEAAMRQADSLRTAILAGQGQTDEALAYLESLAAEAGTSDLGAQIAVIRARLATGERGRALAFAEELLADNPEDPVHRFVVAAVRGATGDQAGAEELYRSLVEAVPQIPEAWLGLIRSMHAQGQTEAAWAVLEEALEVLPDAPDLLWAQASYRERLGDYEGAIAIYERLYEMLPASPVVANNLASLISTYRDDDESLDRAYSIARRLRGSDVPQFQDTYGWIAYRRGDHEEAVEHLEPAAAELAEDPLVQFHLGMTYLALEREEEALEQLRLAAELAGPGDTRSQFAIARDRISELEAVASEAATTEGE